MTGQILKAERTAKAADQSLFLEALAGKKTVRPPFWFMRQAGRYLPEYRKIRAQAGSFLDLCFNPGLAAEVTLQPVRRFGMDAAILFSDILVIPYALGQDLSFQEGEGPKLGLLDISFHEKQINRVTEKLSPVFETIAKVREGLSPDTALIGFSGAPWTVACYMIEGGGSRDFAKVKSFADKNTEDFSRLIDILTKSTIDYLSKQIEAGVDAIQIFDSWAGLVDGDDFENRIIAPTAKIVSALKKKYPSVPIIGFPRGAGRFCFAYAEKTKVDGISLDPSFSLTDAAELQKICTVQGNLSPEILLQGGDALLTKAREISSALGQGPFVFNLGHGIIKETPPEHMARLCDFLRGQRNV